jgi:hypothetical protein
MIENKKDLDKILSIMGIIMTAGLIIKQILEEEDDDKIQEQEKNVPRLIQEDFDWSDPNMGSMG